MRSAPWLRRTTRAAVLLALLGCGEPGGGTHATAPSAVVAPGPSATPARSPAPPADVAPGRAVASAAPAASREEPRVADTTPGRPVAPQPLAAGQTISVPAGVVRAGSRPGTAGRRPQFEADLAPVRLGGFEIDRLPYPNDPSRPPRLGVSRAEAARLCEAEGKRLCTELEWERACKGDTLAELPFAGPYSAEACEAEPLSCESPLGVVAMGVHAREWTASDAPAGTFAPESTAIARGAPATAPADEHRCGARRAFAAGTAAQTLGFRCCAGEVAEVAYPDVGAAARFRVVPADVDGLRRTFASIPQLARFSADFTPFGAEDALLALARGERTPEHLRGWELMDGVLEWSPTPGEEAWVVAGRSGSSSVLAVLYPLADGTLVHGASFVLADEDAPIAVAYTPPSRTELLWSSCWGCVGEGGAVTFTDDSRIVVAHR